MFFDVKYIKIVLLNISILNLDWTNYRNLMRFKYVTTNVINETVLAYLTLDLLLSRASSLVWDRPRCDF